MTEAGVQDIVSEKIPPNIVGLTVHAHILVQTATIKGVGIKMKLRSQIKWGRAQDFASRNDCLLQGRRLI